MEKLLPLIILIPILVFWLWMAWDMDKNDHLSESSKLNWMLILAFLSVFGAMLYFVTEYRKRS